MATRSYLLTSLLSPTSKVSLAALEASGELAELQRLHQVQAVAAARQQADATEEGRQQAARQEEAERQQAPTSLDELD